MHHTQENDEAARCISPSHYSIVQVQEPESRVCDTQHSLAAKEGKVCRAEHTFITFYRQLQDTKKGIVCPKVRSEA